MALKWKNRDIVVLRPVGGMGSWSDDLVVVRVLESGEEETVRKGEIVGYTEDPDSDVVKSGEALVGTSRDPNHPSNNGEAAKKQLEEHNKQMEENRKTDEQKAEQQKLDEAKQAPVVQTVQFDPKNSTVNPATATQTFPAVAKTTSKK